MNSGPSRLRRGLVAPVVGVVAIGACLVLAGGSACSAVLGLEEGTLASSESGTTPGCAEGRATCTAEACATDLAVDLAHCGACGAKCANDHGTSACTAGKCAVTCSAGFADCDGQPSTGCEVELAGSPRHCGRCGHECFGGRCVAGVCQPVAFADTEGEIRQLRPSDTTLFTLDGYTVRAIPLDGATPRVVLAPLAFSTTAFATSKTTVFASSAFSVDGGVPTVAVDGTSAPRCLLQGRAVSAVAADDAAVYVGEVGLGITSALLRIESTSTCTAPNQKILAPTQPPITSIVTDADWVYWATRPGPGAGSIQKIRKDGSGLVTIVAKAKGPIAIAQDAQTVYWIGDRGVSRVSKLTTCDDEAMCTELFAPDGRDALAVDDVAVYVGAGDLDRGWRVAVRNKTNAADLGNILSTERVASITVDSKSVYFGGGRRVFRVAK